MGVLQTDLII